ncbi:hypothetical protein A2U01_0107078, partial [Trifolium medium]|nr:hypothetical protein [Trifolium medium]
MQVLMEDESMKLDETNNMLLPITFGKLRF